RDGSPTTPTRWCPTPARSPAIRLPLDTGVEVFDAVPPDQRTPQTSQPVVVHDALQRHHTCDGLAALGDDQLASPAGHLVDQAEAMRLQFRNRYRPYHLTILDFTWSSVNSHLRLVAARGARRGRIDPGDRGHLRRWSRSVVLHRPSLGGP